MSIEEVTEAVRKFEAYLLANGRRPIALIVQVCDDQTNRQDTIASGLNDVLDATCLAVLAGNRGMALVDA